MVTYAVMKFILVNSYMNTNLYSVNSWLLRDKFCIMLFSSAKVMFTSVSNCSTSAC